MTDHPHYDHHRAHDAQVSPADDRTWAKSRRLGEDQESWLPFRLEAGERSALGGRRS